jgi:hypothetical protein
MAIGGATLAGEIIDRIAVSVGKRVITVTDLDRQIRVIAFLEGKTPDFSPAARRAAAGRMVEQKLIQRELELSRYPVPSLDEIEPLLQEFKKKHYPSDAEYRRALAEYGITEDDVKAELLWQRSLLRFIDVRFRPGVQITEKEIQDYFDKVVAPAARAGSSAAPVALENYRDLIEEKLIGEQVDRELDAWLEETRKRTEIVFHEEVFR